MMNECNNKMRHYMYILIRITTAIWLSKWKKKTERKESGISRQINMVVRLGCALSISFHPEKCSTWCFRNSRLIVHVPQKPYNTSWSLVYSKYFAAVWNSITFVPKIKRRMHSSSLSLSVSIHFICDFHSFESNNKNCIPNGLQFNTKHIWHKHTTSLDVLKRPQTTNNSEKKHSNKFISKTMSFLYYMFKCPHAM